jgi:hypothetical protein
MSMLPRPRLAGLGTPARREIAIAAFAAASAASLLVVLGPTPVDAPAHLYRTFLVSREVFVWDNLWYGGQYPLASYSLFYYLPAALVGNLPLVFLATVASAALFAAIVTSEWPEAGPWPARTFAVFASGPLVTGTYSYALGLAALLCTVRALQQRRTWLAILAAALTLGFSPLAFVFLGLVLLAVVLVRRRLGSWALWLAPVLLVLAAIEVLATLIFPEGGLYPFSAWDLSAVLTVSLLGAALTVRARHGRILAVFFVLWGFASVAAFLVPSPIGDNLTRLRLLVFPVMLLGAVLARFRPRPLAAIAVFLAFAYNVVPYVATIPFQADARAAEAGFWSPALAFLRARSQPNYRVEVVPTSGHWEAYWLPRAGFALARGWYRQLDIAGNSLLYQRRLSPRGYRDWLRSLGVRYVVLADTRLDPVDGQVEADLVRSPRSGLVRALSSEELTIYELPAATPILTGPGQATITDFDHERIGGLVDQKGRYLLRVRYTPYWQVRGGDVCLEPAHDGMTELIAGRPGRFLLVLPDEAEAIVSSLLHGAHNHC